MAYDDDLQAINELWLSHVTSKESSNLKAGSPIHVVKLTFFRFITTLFEMKALLILKFLMQPVVFLPSLDHLRAVRILTKHLHYFANSIGPNIISGMDELKR